MFTNSKMYEVPLWCGLSAATNSEILTLCGSGALLYISCVPSRVCAVSLCSWPVFFKWLLSSNATLLWS